MAWCWDTTSGERLSGSWIRLGPFFCLMATAASSRSFCVLSKSRSSTTTSFCSLLYFLVSFSNSALLGPLNVCQTWISTGAPCAAPATAMAAPKIHVRRLALSARVNPANCSVFIGSQTKKRKIGLRLASAEQIGQGPARTCSHGPAQRTVACIQVQVGNAGTTDEGHVRRSGRAQPRPIADALEIERVGKQFARQARQGFAAAGVQRARVAGEFGGARHAQAVAEPREHHLVAAVGEAHRRRARRIAHREGG